MDLDPDIRNRALAGVALVAVLGYGIHDSGAVERASVVEIERISKLEVTAREAETKALERQLNFKSKSKYLEVRLAEDLEKLGLATMTLEELKAPQAFFDELSKPVTLKAGKSWRSKHLRVKATVEKVRFQQQGAMVGARHSVATAENISDTPIAYFLDVGAPDERDCKARGARMHNAMALLPGESAEIAVCAGGGAVLISDVKVLETTPIGYHYFSRVPPVAVGHDAVTGQAHRPQGKFELCTTVPAVRLANFLRSGDATWQDVADFYTRHPCDDFQFTASYEHSDEPRPELPAVPPTGSR